MRKIKRWCIPLILKWKGVAIPRLVLVSNSSRSWSFNGIFESSNVSWNIDRYFRSEQQLGFGKFICNIQKLSGQNRFTIIFGVSWTELFLNNDKMCLKLGNHSSSHFGHRCYTDLTSITVNIITFFRCTKKVTKWLCLIMCHVLVIEYRCVMCIHSLCFVRRLFFSLHQSTEFGHVWQKSDSIFLYLLILVLKWH